MGIGDHILPLLRRARFYANVPEVLELLRFRELRAAYYRDYWTRAATEIGAETGEWPGGLRWIKRNGKTIPVKLYHVPLDDHLTVELLGNKPVVLSLLAELGCPVPAFHAFSMQTLDRAEAFNFTVDRPFVVKPAAGAGAGRGVTTGVTGARALRRAAAYASRFSSELLAEEQIDGSSFRLLYLNGRLIDAIRRDPPRLTGDGRNSIRRLIKLENLRRRRDRPYTALSPIRIDPDMKAALAAQGLSLNSHLEDRRIVAVKRACNENAAAQNYNVLDKVHGATDAMCTRAVRALGTAFAGVDIICRDISAPLTRDNGVIGEINATPGLHHHDLIAELSRRAPVARLVLEHVFRTHPGIKLIGAAAATEAA
jgi:D-alanine-D-alanine ligase-like ATP-grasp enzyme